MTTRTFRLIRSEDVTGASGTGHVADGCEFPDGTTVIRWRGDHASIVIWPDLKTAMRVHSHDGRTRAVWDDGHNDDGLIVLRRVEVGPQWVNHDRVTVMSLLDGDDMSPEEAREFAAKYASAADIAERNGDAQ